MSSNNFGINNWIYQGTVFDTAPEEYQGFVYLITNLALNKFYIGKKNFWTVKKLPPLKGKRNKRHRKTETDWQDYWGSSDALLADLELIGVDNFRREITYLCSSKSQMSYIEAKQQFQQDVLLRDDYYNGIISCKIHRNHLKKG